MDIPDSMSPEQLYKIAERAARGLPASTREDLIQIGVAKLLTTQGNSPGHYYTIARNEMVTALRGGLVDGMRHFDRKTKTLLPLRTESEDVLSVRADPAPSPAIAEEFRDLVETALSSVKPRDESLLRAYYGIGQPAQTAGELAEALGVSPARIFQRLTALHRKLKLLLE